MYTADMDSLNYLIDYLFQLPNGAACFGLNMFQQPCPNISQGSITFSLGEYIGALALFLGFTQLQTPIHRFRLYVSSFGIRQMVRVLFIASVGVALANLCFIWADITPFPYGSPITYEIPSAALVFLGGIWFILNSIRYAQFRKRNAERWFQAVREYLMNETDEDLGKLADDLTENWAVLIKHAEIMNRHNENKRWEQEDNQPSHSFKKQIQTRWFLWKNQAIGQWAHMILELLEDQKFLTVLATRQPVSAIYLFRAANAGGQNLGSANKLVQGVFQHAIMHPQSALGREMEYTGLGGHKPFLTELTSQKWLAHNSGYLHSIYFRLSIEESWQVKRLAAVYVEVAKRLLSHQYYGDGNHTWWQLEHTFEDACRDVGHAIRKTDPNTGYPNASYELGHLLENLTKLIKDNVPREGASIPLPQEGEQHNRNDWHAPYSTLANMYFAYFDMLSRRTYKDSFDYYSSARSNGWHYLYNFQAKTESESLKSVQLHFEQILFEQLNDNLDKTMYTYPLLVPLLLRVYTWLDNDPQPGCADNGYNRVKERFKKLLNEKFHKAWLERGNELLPLGAEYNARSRTITLSTGLDGKGRTSYKLKRS